VYYYSVLREVNIMTFGQHFRMHVPRWDELTPEQVAEREAEGWAFCLKCNMMHAAVLTETHAKLCRGSKH